MNLTELQIELRNIEDRISALQSQIEKMKPQTDEKKKTDFDAITKMAKRHPINNLSITEAPELLRKDFIYSLSYLVLVEENNIYERLLYLNRLAYGCKLDLSVEDIYKAGIEFDEKDIEKICSDLQEYKYNYLVEAFILSNLLGEASASMLTAISDMANLIGYDQEEICVLAQVAKSRLMCDPDIIKDIPFLSENRWSGKLGDYISKEWIVSQRKECVRILIEGRPGIGEVADLCVIKSILWSGSAVKKDEIILVYEENRKTVTILAPFNGIVYYIITKNDFGSGSGKLVSVYMVSYFDDYDELCEWHIAKVIKEDSFSAYSHYEIEK